MFGGFTIHRLLIMYSIIRLNVVRRIDYMASVWTIQFS